MMTSMMVMMIMICNDTDDDDELPESRSNRLAACTCK